jgi:Xaa-Pro aminopeptidase
MEQQDILAEERLAAALSDRGLDALIVTRDANQRYLEGFTGSECYLLSSGRKSWLVADSRYTEQGAKECRRATVVQHRSPCPPYNEVIASIAAKEGLQRIGFEKEHLTYGQYETLKQNATAYELLPSEGPVEDLRLIKSPDEIGKLRKACAIADAALEALLPRIHEGMSELALARELESLMFAAGAEGISFETIAAFGAHSSMPHAVPSATTLLKRGDFILLDFGALYAGYHSDITRTLVFGAANARQKEIYAATLDAQLAGFEAMLPGASGKAIDELVRGRIAAAGLPEYSHGLGHGVGLEIHERPFMGRLCKESLAASMVVTCEPGIYVPGEGGVRVEDSVLVTTNGPEALTRFPKDRLIEV